MRKSLIVIFTIGLVLAALFVTLQKQSALTPVTVVQKGLPWQIDLVDGNSRVFGLTIGKSTLADAVQLIGPDFELAILSKPQQAGMNGEALELFTTYFTSGPLSGNLIVVADTTAGQIQQLRNSLTVREKHLESGALMTTLRFEQQQPALSYTIKSITFIPTARLDKGLVEQRFGQPLLTLKTAEKVTSYLYPERGLNIIIDEAGKDFLQYVSPGAFAELQADIQHKADSYNKGL